MKLDLEEAISYLQEQRNSLLTDHRVNRFPDKEQVESEILRLYSSFSFQEPQIIWLANPWQLMYAPALFTGFTKKQISVFKIHNLVMNLYQDLLIEEIGRTHFNLLWDSFWIPAPERQLRNFSDTVETEIRLLERELAERNNDLCLRFAERLTSKDYGRGLCLESSVLSRTGNRINWFALEHYTGSPPPWEHMSSTHHLQFDESRLGLEGRPMAPDAVPPIMGWGHLLRLGHALELFADRFLKLAPSESARAELAAFERLGKSVHAFACFPEVCFISEPPIDLHIHNEQLHNSQGPAISYAEGFDIFCWNNVRVPARALEKEPSLDIIEAELNIEAKRVLVERYGYEQYLNDSNAEKIQEDERGAIYKITSTFGIEITLLAVQNSTPEPDGSFKKYFLRVPPDTRTAREAVAWSFQMHPDLYQPTTES